MSTLTRDDRISFKTTVPLGHASVLTAKVVKGVIISVQVAIFNKADQQIGGVGVPGLGPVLTSEVDGTVRWVFEPPMDAHYIKWGIRPFRSAGDGSYAVSYTVQDAGGPALVTGGFEGKIPTSDQVDDIVFDGVFVSVAPSIAGVPAGAVV